MDLKRKLIQAGSADRCPHTEAVSTVNAGLQRTVCHRCGSIALSIDSTYRSSPLRRRPAVSAR